MVDWVNEWVKVIIKDLWKCYGVGFGFLVLEVWKVFEVCEVLMFFMFQGLEKYDLVQEFVCLVLVVLGGEEQCFCLIDLSLIVWVVCVLRRVVR